jgi:hypothetical protein
MNPQKVASIVEWPVPTTVKELQAFLGLGNYYRKFIRDYSALATPMFFLLRKDQKFAWGQEQQQAFEKLKAAFIESPVRKMFNWNAPITIETDASDYAIGAILSQPDENHNLHPIVYHSRKMIPAERNYNIHDKELLAIVDAFKEWRVYLEGAKHQVTVISDHKNLTHFTTTKELTRRQVRWAQYAGYIISFVCYFLRIIADEERRAAEGQESASR